MCVIEGIESVIDDGRSPHNLFLTRIYGLFYFETCVIDDKRVRLRTDAYKHIWFDLIRSIPRVFKNILSRDKISIT